MNTAGITIIVLGVIALLFAGAALFLLKAKAESESASRSNLDQLNEKLKESAKSEGQVKELSRQVGSLQADVKAKDQELGVARQEQNRLTRELAVAQTEADAAHASATQYVQQEKDACEATIQRLKTSYDELLQKEREACTKVIAAKDREIQAKDDQIENLKTFIEKANETLGNQFKAISQETLKDVSAQFEKAAKQVIDQNSESTAQKVLLHREQIEKLLQPVGHTLETLSQQVKDTNEKRGQAEAVLMSQIKDFAGANTKLANALNKPVIRGSFAETKLESLLEAAGLVKGENFELQSKVKEGEQIRIVDALVNMAQGKKLVIDSKNLLVPFVEYANAPEEEREAKLAEFQKAFRSTLRALSLKDYAKHWEGIDAVIMFLPDEGMYMAALESDRQLIATMFEHRVFTVSPISLLPILKSVSYILGLEKQNRDTQTIVDAGRNLYESLGVILAKVKTLGDRLEGGVEAYNEVIASFEGNVLPKTRTLRSLGIQKGHPHKEIVVIESPRRDFKSRVIQELGVPAEVLNLEEVN